MNKNLVKTQEQKNKNAPSEIILTYCAPTYRCLGLLSSRAATSFEFPWIILPLLRLAFMPTAPPAPPAPWSASGSPDAQQFRAEGRLVPSIATLVQSRPSLLVITSWAMQAGLKTALRVWSAIDSREVLNFEPRSTMLCHFQRSSEESGRANWSAMSWK